MNINHDHQRNLLHEAFSPPPRLYVRVTAGGFLVGETVLKTLLGRVSRVQLRRKRFEDGALLCHSDDGVHGREGLICAECRHPRCRPFLRVELLGGVALYVFDLNSTSARNLLKLENATAEEGRALCDFSVMLSIIDRGHWGEVAFERVP